MPTEACNFRCVYCYEDFKYKRMEPWVVDGVKGLLSRRAPGLASLEISWFGGEPLLAADVVEDIMRHVRSLIERHPDIRLASDMTTNGYLLDPPMFRRMLGLGVDDYQITIDGPREWHDRRRVTAGGKGTFDRIWGNLLAMRDVGDRFTIQVRVHADRQNLELLPGFLQIYREAFGADPRFTLFIRGLSRLGGPNDSTLDVFEREEGDRVIGDLRDLARAQGLKLAETTGDDAICYAARANSFLVRANGRLNKCTIALEHPANQVGRIHEDGTVEVAAQAMGPWMRGLWSGTPEELKCPMFGLADGAAKAAPETIAETDRAVPAG
jgi:uncharacterized protein